MPDAVEQTERGPHLAARDAESMPPRRMPTTFTERATAGMPSAIMKGGTSWVTLEQPPM